MPFNTLLTWLSNEKEFGITESEYAILSTSCDNVPHSRVVAIRSIEANSLVFFTQRLTRKVAELLNNPLSSLNFYFSHQQRQIILEGSALPLSPEENNHFWQLLPRERQLRFSTYAPTSGQVISSLDQLDEKKQLLASQWANQVIPMSDCYCGFRFTPETCIFYTVGSDNFSDVTKYTKNYDSWKKERLSP